MLLIVALDADEELDPFRLLYPTDFRYLVLYLTRATLLSNYPAYL